MSFRAMYAGLRGDFTGHQRYLTVTETVAVVVVTYNRADLLGRMLEGLARARPRARRRDRGRQRQHRPHPRGARRGTPGRPRSIRTDENLGGAGGFHRGVKAAYDQGFDRIWLMDDDVVPAPDCLTC